MTVATRDAVAAIAPDGVVEVRALADYAIHSGYFDDPDALSRQVEALDVDTSVAGIYITLNAVNPALLSRRANRIKMRLSKKDATTSDADIIRRRWLPIDIDPMRPSGVSSTDEEHDAALSAADRIALFLAEQGFPSPIRADSGNGAHLLYRVDLPNNEEATGLVKGCLATIDALFSNAAVTVDTANYNAARIWKLYGTMSRKGDSTAERPHRRARLLSVPEEIAIVPLERLQHLAGLLPREEPQVSKKNGIELRTWLTGHGIGIGSERPWQGGTLYTLEECPFSSAHRDGAFAVQFANGAIFAGCHHSSCGGGTQRWPELRERYEPREQGEAPPPPPAVDECRTRALEILQHGDPFAFLLDTFNKEHVGDRVVAECLILSVASQSVANTNGLHVSISGNSGKGKTHACNAMLALLPEEYRLKGTVSNKALYYHENLQPGTVLLFDDVSLSDDLQEVLKSATANFREQIEHRTLTADRQLRICRIPERCVWWLAKVESVGDDQVANRMLSVWIDDSAGQDRAVLEHLTRRAARGASTDEDPDVLIARALWRVVKQELIPVVIPFATQIRFTSADNRRNPAMLLDLIRCHAVLRSMQRERDAGGNLIATRDDFTEARRLFLKINADAGGQATKLTRNEAGALSTVSAMGVTVFTIRMLQQATGLSYYQTYRILHGYTARGATHAGLLEKCPAIGLVDTMVAGEEGGYTVRRREHHYLFDADLYRTWISGGDVWLDSAVCSFAAPLQRSCNEGCKQEEPKNEPDVGDNHEYRDIGICTDSTLHQHGEACGSPSPGSGTGAGVCDPEQVARRSVPPAKAAGNCSRPPVAARYGCIASCKDVQSAANVLPLPGVLDHRAFERVSVDIGRCRICDTGKAVYRSRSDQTCICEGCYARLVREWNQKEGMR